MSFFKKLQNFRSEEEDNHTVISESDGLSDTDPGKDSEWLEAGVSKPRPYRPSEDFQGAGRTVKPRPSERAATSGNKESKALRPGFRAERNSNAEFNQALEEILWVIKESLPVHTVSLFWVNRNRKQYVLESCVTDAQSFSAEERISFSEDSYLQKILETRNPVIRFKIPAEDSGRLLPYYGQSEGINSFLGIPVFFGEEICAVLFADSLRPDAFGGDEVAFFNRLGKLVSHLVFIYSMKDDLEFSNRYTQQMSTFVGNLQQLKNVRDLMTEVTSFIQQAFEFNYCALVTFDTTGELSVQKVISQGNKAYVEEGLPVAIDHSVVGAVMRSLKPMILKSTEASLEGRFRFQPGEALNLNTSLIAVPVSSANKCYGAIVLEHDVKGWFTSSHLQCLEQTGFMTGLMMENIYLDESAGNQKIYDEETGVFDHRFFMDRLSVELTRALRVGFDLCLVVFEIDRFQEHEEKLGTLVTDMASSHLAKLLKVNLRNYDYLGRLGRNRFAALMVHSDATNAFLIAEKIRESVASSPIRFERIELPVTISIGISRFKKEKASADYLIDGALAALQRARETGGNNVKTN